MFYTQAYTINNESQHLFIYGVPKINLRYELKQLCQKYGIIKLIAVETKYKTEMFTECYHVLYERIQSARIAKRLLDNKSFYGSVLHVCYAPELETIEETRNKLEQRKKDVEFRLKQNALNNFNNQSTAEFNQLDMGENSQNDCTVLSTNKVAYRKRKHPAIAINETRLQNIEDSNRIWDGIPQEIDPRISNVSSTNKNIVIRKHYQIESKVINLAQNNLKLTTSVSASSNVHNNSKNTESKLIVKKKIKENVKRIVFLNNKTKINIDET